MGRGVVVLPGDEPPLNWASCPRVVIDDASLEDPGAVAEELHGYWFDRRPVVVELGADPAALRAESPLAHVENIRVPVLLVHGEDDYTVLADHSRAMDRALSREHVPHELVLIRHGEHSLVRPEMRLMLYRKVTEFLRANLGPDPRGAAAPVSAVADH